MNRTSSEVAADVSAKIANLGIFCAFLVLFIHIPHDTRPNYVYIYFTKGLSKIAVPFFFVASGYLLACRFGDDGWYRSAIVKRLRTLYVPMTVWCILYFICKDVVPAFFSGQHVHLNLETAARLLALHPFREPYVGVLWFMKTLLIFVVFSPLLRHLSSPIPILAMFVAQLCLGPTLGGTPPPLRFTLLKGYFPICGAAFFCLGMMLKLRNATLRIPRGAGLALLTVGLALMFLRLGVRRPVWLQHAAFAYVPFLLAGVWSLCPSKRLPAFLVQASFAVYVMHYFVITVFERVLRNAFGRIDTLLYVVFGLLCFAVCVAASVLAHRFLPRWLQNTLFGGR